MGALTNLHVGKNSIPEKEMREIMAIAMRMDSMKILCEVPFKDKNLTELDISRKDLGTEGALVVAEHLDGNRALTFLDLSSNSLTGKHGDDMSGNTELSVVIRYRTTPDISFAGITALANAIPDMGALYKLILKDNRLATAEAGEALGEALKGNTVLKELDVSGNLTPCTTSARFASDLTRATVQALPKGYPKGCLAMGPYCR
jgi:Ran GTPase-activating protein (RanGAP) involved in mRNA processing and transport